MFDRTSVNDVNVNPKEQPHSSFFQFSSDFDHADDGVWFFQHQNELLVGQFPQQQIMTVDTSSETVADAVINMEHSKMLNGDSGGPSNCKESFDQTEQIPRKRSVKKDRHSKIYTAQGLRDRRMRLSLEIARKFFTLQDMLGFDKASKTVEWLLTKSKAAIKELSRGLDRTAKSVSSTSECEVLSGVDETHINEARQGKVSKGKSSAGIPKGKKIRQSRKSTFHPQARVSREKARERARERTMEKIWSRRFNKSKQCPEANLHSLNQQMETGEESGSHSHDVKSSLEVGAEDEEPSSHSLEYRGPIEKIVDEPLMITCKSSPASIFNYHHDIEISQGVSPNNNNNNFPNFPQNWDIDGARTHSSYCAMTNMHLSTDNAQERIPTSFFLTSSDARFQSQFADIQFYSKPWEPCNNQSLC